MVLDGKKIAEELLVATQTAVAHLSRQPKLVDVVVGDDAVQMQFVRMKQKKAEAVGIHFVVESLPLYTTTEAVVARLLELGQDAAVDAVVVQLPLPAHIETDTVLNAIAPHQDVDGLGATSRFVAPTAEAIVTILDSLHLQLQSEVLVVVGQGRLVGAPVTKLLRARGLEVTVVDEHTENAAAILQQATVLISAVGKPHFIRSDTVSAGVVVIDAGTSESGGVVMGDVAPEVAEIARYMTPVPGGVGPVTVACLLRHVVQVVEVKHG